MEQRYFARLISLALCFELIVAPILPHYNVSAQEEKKKKGNKINQTINDAQKLIGNMEKIWKTSQNTMPSQMAKDMEGLKFQQSPQKDKYFNTEKLLQIPGLAKYLAINNINPQNLNCSTLPSTIYEADPEVCRVGLMDDVGLSPDDQVKQMYTYYNQYFQISKLYRNFESNANTEGQAFGLGCMNNALQILNGFFKYRTDELDKLMTNLEAIQNQFREASRSDLDAIEEMVAVLEGGNGTEMSDKIRSKKPDLFDYKKRFNNPACNSIFAGDQLNSTGNKGGLNSINEEMKKIISEKRGNYSGESYSLSHTAIVEDINNLSDKVSTQFEFNFQNIKNDPKSYNKFLTDIPNLVSSPLKTQTAFSSDVLSDTQTKFNEKIRFLDSQKNTIMSELRGSAVSGDETIMLLGNNVSNNFNDEIVTLENRIKNQCLDSTLSKINRDTLLSKIYDPTASKHANKFASNFFKDKFKEILNNKNSSFEKKLSELKLIDNGRYYLKMENSYEVQEINVDGNIKRTKVEASTVRTPSIFFSDMIRNCNAQYRANKLNNKMTGESVIKNLKTLNMDYKDLMKSQMNDMRSEIRKKMIECSSPELANNSVAGSCTPQRFEVSSPGFCANAALSCSKNMQACNQQSDNFVKQIKTQRTARVNNYKALIQKNKMDIINIFDSSLARYMNEGLVLRGLFGAGFASPNGIQREVPEDQRYLNEFKTATSSSVDGKLLLEDPEKYISMFKENITKLKDSVKAQQDQILGGDSIGKNKNTGILLEHISQTEENFKGVVDKADEIAKACLAKHDQSITTAKSAREKQYADFEKKRSEFGEKEKEFCQRFNQALNGHPGPACDGNINDLVMAIGDEANEFAAYCDDTQNKFDGTELFEKLCPNIEGKDLSDDCKKLRNEIIITNLNTQDNNKKLTSEKPTLCNANDESGREAQSRKGQQDTSEKIRKNDSGTGS
jgi:hypothetical protein